MKKFVIVLLIVSLLIPSFIMEGVFGSSFTLQPLEKYQHNRVHYESIKHLIPDIPEKSANDYPLNATLYIDKGIIVYGNWSSLGSKNDFKVHAKYPTENPTGKPYYELNGKSGEYRYHGFDQQGNPYTNIHFPKDADSSRSGNEKDWIYRPFQEYNGRDRIAIRSQYTEWAIEGNHPDPQVNIKTRNWINRMINNDSVNFEINSKDHSSKNPYDYIHVLSPSDVGIVGEGRMWHVHNSRRYYQTFSIPTQKPADKVLLPTEAEIKILTPPAALKLKHGQQELTIDVEVKGIYQDGDHWKTEEGRTAYYTRRNIEEWKMTLDTTGQTSQAKVVKKGGENTGVARFQVTIPREQLEANPNLQFNASAQAIFVNDASSGTARTQTTISIDAEETKALVSLFTVNNYITLVNGSNFHPSHLNYQDASLGDIVKYEYFIQYHQNGQTTLSYEVPKADNTTVNEAIGSYIKTQIIGETDGEFEFLIKQTVTDRIGRRETYEQKVIVDIKPPEVRPDSQNPKIEVEIPDRWFDIVPLPVSNNSENVSNPRVFIDGIKVNAELFFSGGYVFGESEVDRLLPIEIVFDSSIYIIGGMGKKYEASTTKWIYVHSTKPRAEFKLEGTYKENRKLTVTDNSNNVNSQFVLDHYPLSNYQWRFKGNGGDINDLRLRDISDLYKELMFKKAGGYTIELVVTNTLGRVSDPYEVDLWIMEDYDPAVILNIWNNTLARNEEMKILHDAVSTDGDTISKNTIQIYYDHNNDGNASQLMGTFNASEFQGYTPTKLGTYKLVNTVEEAFGEATLEEYITQDDTVKKVVEREFFVDNFIPMTDLYIDIPLNLPEIDVFFMMDKDLQRTKNDYIVNGRMDINNYLRTQNIRPKVETWDMHTYVYSQAASSTRYTGGTPPSSTISYSSNGYSGTLPLVNVSNSPYTVDEGYNTTVYETVTTTDTEWSYAEDWPGSGWRREPGSGWYRTITTTEEVPKEVWIDDWVTYNDYTGYYSGTIYKILRQPYVDPFRTLADKYIIYVSDGNIGELEDLKMVMEKADTKVILIGEETIKSQVPNHVHFIKNGNRPIETIVKEALDYIAESNPYVGKYYVVAGEESFKLSHGNYDDEGDSIVEEGFQYVQDSHYYDTPLGMEGFTNETYQENTWTSRKVTQFNTTGKFDIYRRIKDKPSEDPRFANFSYYSNIPQITVYSHRRPIALAELDWDYDAGQNIYLTTWVDKSFDWDHVNRREDKGIQERKVRYRVNDGEWIYKVPDKLLHGSYELEYYVKDVENTWSDPFKLNFTLSPAPPIQFDAKARAKDAEFYLGSIPASEYLEIYEAWTRYPYDVKLEVALYQGTVRKTPVKTIQYSPTTGAKVGNDIQWNNISYQIPETLPDGSYTLKVSAIGEGGQIKHKDFPVTVRTPINLVVENLPIFIADTTVSLKGKTTKYPHQVVAKLYYQTPHQRSVSMTATLTGKNKDWKLQHNVPNDLMDGFYKIEFTATTPNGNKETLILTHQLLNLKMEKLRIGAIMDFNWEEYFQTPGKRPTPLALEGIHVKDMPVFRNKRHQGIKLGYKVKFKIDSIGLQGQGDEISIKARYYALDTKNDLYDTEIYVETKEGDFIKMKDSPYYTTAGNMTLNPSNRKPHELNPEKSHFNTWEFDVFIPYFAKVVKKGEELDLFDDNTFDYRLLVALDIQGKKADGTIYDYTLKENQWGMDNGKIYGGNLPTRINLAGKGINHGEVFWYDLGNTAFDDVKIQRGW